MTITIHVRERTRIVRALDIAGFIRLIAEQGDGEPTPEAAEIALHKIRSSPAFPVADALRKESQQWLEARGYTPEVVQL